jgi:hypothetical protein
MIEIDQSNKIERTEKDTVLAMSNRHKRAILIPAKVKRDALKILRESGKSRNIAHYQLFAISVYLLILPYLPVIMRYKEHIMIDTEYTGQEDKIKGSLLECIYQEGFIVPKNRIFFAQVGKSSKAHKIAWMVQRGLIQADHTISLEELLPFL